MKTTGNWARSAAALAALAMMAGCSVTPRALTPEDVRSRVDKDKARMYEQQEPVRAEVSFEEAVARALKYNLDYRVKKMEAALALGLTEQASADMLPKLVASAGYSTRGNDAGGVSRNLLTGETSTQPSTNDERRHNTRSVEFAWNALDFGVSYYRARQQADQYLVAQERRRKVVQNIVQDVRIAYWRALGAQRLNAQTKAVLERAELALSRSQQAESQKVISPGLALAYQRALLDATLLLQQRRQDLEYARKELAALMNVPPGAEFTVADIPEARLVPAPGAADVRRLEDMALLQRPELREEDLKARISADEARKQVVSLLPGISLNLGARTDSNRLLYNDSWSEGGLNVAWNLMRLLSLPSTLKSHQHQEQADELRRMALSMAVLTQVRLGAEQYRMALEELKLTDRSAQVDKRAAAFARDAVSTRIGSELEAIRTEARAALGAYQRASAYSSAQIALGKLYNSLGFDPITDDFDGLTLSQVTDRVRTHLRAVEADAFAFSSSLFGRMPGVQLQVEGVEDPVQQVRLKAVASQLLGGQDIDVNTAGGPRLVLAYQGPSGAGLQRVRWNIGLQDEVGVTTRPIGQFETTLPSDAGPSAREASLASALNAHLPVLREQIGQQP